MLFNHLKIILRIMRKQKLFTFINIIGLTAGLSVCVFIMVWIQHELNYDSFHKNTGSIYRVNLKDATYKEMRNYASTPTALAKAIKNKFPEITKSTTYKLQDRLLITRNESVLETKSSFANPDFFDIFSYDFVKGDKQSALTLPYSVVITETMAHKLFGDTEPLDKIITVNNKTDFKITAVIKDIPKNSYFQCELFFPFKHYKELMGSGDENNWHEWGYNTFVLLNENTNVSYLNTKIADFAAQSATFKWKPKLYLQALKDIHIRNINGGGIITYIYIFTVIAVFVLLIACINFMNLTTARTSVRTKEIGLRKVVGANKLDLTMQFYLEAVFITVLSLFSSLLIVKLLVPVFNQYSGKYLTFNILHNLPLIGALLILSIFTGIISGSYPALYLSSLKPVAIFKGKQASGSSLFRSVLVIFQFTMTAILIVATLFISRQLNYLRAQNPGFEKSYIVFVPLNRESKSKVNTIKHELLKKPSITHVAVLSDKIGIKAFASIDVNQWEGNDQQKSILMNIISVSPDFTETFQINMAAGRFFSEDIASDSLGFVINETAVKQMGLKNPVGKSISGNGRIIGVIKDFNFNSLHSEIKPCAFDLDPRWYNYLAIKIKPSEIEASLQHIEKTINSIAPGFPFSYNFMDQDFESLYQSEQQLGKLFTSFALLTIIISSMGLFGLSIFMVERRTKEIGIRKVAGASVPAILLLFYKNISKWVLLANLIAWPVSWLFINNWLKNYAYRINLSVTPFLITGLITILLALFTISFHTLKAAMTNPVQTLKYE